MDRQIVNHIAGSTGDPHFEIERKGHRSGAIRRIVLLYDSVLSFKVLTSFDKIWTTNTMPKYVVIALETEGTIHSTKISEVWFENFLVSNRLRRVWTVPRHPTRVASSLVFAIRQTRNRFVNPILSNRHESFPLLSIRHAGSRFVRDLENIADLDFEGRLKMLSIRVDSIESTWIVRIDWSLWPRFKNEEGSCIVISRILTSGEL